MTYYETLSHNLKNKTDKYEIYLVIKNIIELINKDLINNILKQNELIELIESHIIPSNEISKFLPNLIKQDFTTDVVSLPIYESIVKTYKKIPSLKYTNQDICEYFFKLLIKSQNDILLDFIKLQPFSQIYEQHTINPRTLSLQLKTSNKKIIKDLCNKNFLCILYWDGDPNYIEQFCNENPQFNILNFPAKELSRLSHKFNHNILNIYVQNSLKLKLDDNLWTLFKENITDNSILTQLLIKHFYETKPQDTINLLCKKHLTPMEHKFLKNSPFSINLLQLHLNNSELLYFNNMSTSDHYKDFFKFIISNNDLRELALQPISIQTGLLNTKQHLSYYNFHTNNSIGLFLLQQHEVSGLTHEEEKLLFYSILENLTNKHYQFANQIEPTISFWLSNLHLFNSNLLAEGEKKIKHLLNDKKNNNLHVFYESSLQYIHQTFIAHLLNRNLPNSLTNKSPKKI